MTLFGERSNWSGDVVDDAAALQREAASLGFNWDSVIDVLEKVREETGELEAALRDGDRDATMHELGDMFLALINIACMSGLNSHDVIRSANERFRDRFTRMRRHIESQGRRFEECTLQELDAAWKRIKDV